VITGALGEYVKEVREGSFPQDQHCYKMLKGEFDKFKAWVAEKGDD
jgi:hypothetical protein